jgi:hypothetical protein
MPIKYTDEHWDRVRDYRKHEPRPGEADYVPLHAQSAPISGALEVAILAQAVPLQAAADLIQQYADTVAAGARLDATAEAIDACCNAIEKAGAVDA